jgi:hypothetical protein
MANFPRIQPYKTFALSEDGARTPVTAHEIVLERPVGVDLEINVAPHPVFLGRVSFSTFRGRSLLLEAGSSGDAYIFIEDWPVGDRRRKASRRRHSRTTSGHVYVVDARGEKRTTDARTFVIQTSPHYELQVELCPSAPWARHVKIKSSSDLLSIHLNASNVVFFEAATVRKAKALRRSQ